MANLPALIADWLRAREYNAKPVTAQILQHVHGSASPSTSGRCCIFAHYDRHGIIDFYVVEYLRRLRELDTDIIFVTTSDKFGPEEIEKISVFCRDIVQRVNVSLDFGSWHLGIRILGEQLAAYRQLILANDSVYGPLRSLKPIFQEMEARHLDFWGMTESIERAPHIQSYFLVFEKSGLESPFFRKFWNNFRHQWRKRRLIGKYEIGLSRRAGMAGMRFGSWLSREGVGSGKLNPTLFFWEKLIEQFGYPFLKTEILKINRFNSPHAARWREIVSAAGDYDPELIAQHLRRVGSAVEPGR